MITIALNTLTIDEIKRLDAEAAEAGAESTPAFVVGLLRARWERMETVESSCSNCGFESVCNDTESPTGWCSGWYEALHAKRTPAQEQAREGVAAELASYWLGMSDCNGGASLVVEPDRIGIVFGWPDGTGEPYVMRLDGSQLRALADIIADLYQCECDQWYRGGTICPRCGEERE